jgi:hypothetical protein
MPSPKFFTVLVASQFGTLWVPCHTNPIYSYHFNEKPFLYEIWLGSAVTKVDFHWIDYRKLILVECGLHIKFGYLHEMK